MSRISRSIWMLATIELVALLLGFGPARAQYNVSLRFRDENGRRLAVRAGAFSGTVPRPPSDQAGHLYQSLGTQSFFYCDGNATVNVPAGPLTVRVGRGFEYLPRDTTVVISGYRTIRVTLHRFRDMSSLGYYSGDTHVHITHPPLIYSLDAGDLRLVADAEDLNLINSMEEQPWFTGAVDPASNSERIIFFSKEQRNAHLSHLTVLGLKQWVVDQGCVEQGIACGRTLDASIHAQVHAQAGETAVIATHPFSTFDMSNVAGWPGVGMWRGMSIDLAAGAVDAVDLLNYSNAPPASAVPPYFQVLNAGFRMPPSAGTDCVLGSGESAPAGGVRVYVKPAGPFNMDTWIAGLKAGRSFVSNGPLFTHFDLAGRVPGDVVTDDDALLHGSVSVTCAVPLQKVEIYGDTGLLVKIVAAGGSSRSISGTFDIQRAGLSWVVARATGLDTNWHAITADGLFAQTAPVYIGDGAGTDVTRTMAADYFLGQLDDAVAVFDEVGYFPGDSRAAFDNAVTFARQFYQGLASTSTGVAAPALISAWSLGVPRPNPFSGDVRLRYTVPDAAATHVVDVFDAAGRAVRTLYSGARPGGDYELSWDGRDGRGAPVPSGVYFVRVKPRGAAAVSRKLVLIR